jgi:hypothetical protein
MVAFGSNSTGSSIQSILLDNIFGSCDPHPEKIIKENFLIAHGA